MPKHAKEGVSAGEAGADEAGPSEEDMNWRQRRERATRKSLEVLPAENRPAMSWGGTTRSCGECQACCFVHEIAEVGKPMSTTCPHQCYAGCDRHGVDKPKECADYMCAWSMGMLVGDDTRPDRTGLVVDIRYLQDADTGAPTPRVTVSIYEVFPGAALSPTGWRLVTKLAETGNDLCLVPFGAPRIGPGVLRSIVLYRRKRESVHDGVFNVLSGQEAREEVDELIERMF